MRTVTLRPRRSVPALVADLYDGSGSINLVWLGRRTIGGIEPGAYLRATGRVTSTRGIADHLQPGLRDRAVPWPLTPRPRAPGRPPAPTVEELIRHRLSTALGGWRGSLETALPTIAFVGVWTLPQDVTLAVVAAGVIAVLLAGVRVVQRQSLQFILSAVFATGDRRVLRPAAAAGPRTPSSPASCQRRMAGLSR